MINFDEMTNDKLLDYESRVQEEIDEAITNMVQNDRLIQLYEELDSIHDEMKSRDILAK